MTEHFPNFMETINPKTQEPQDDKAGICEENLNKKRHHIAENQCYSKKCKAAGGKNTQ